MRRDVSYPLSFRSPATRLVLAFVIWSALWIIISDSLLHRLFPPAATWSLQTEKGLIYVLVSGFLLWLAVRSMEREEESRRALNESKLRRLNESGLLAVAERNARGRISYVNETFAQMLGYTYHEVLGAEVRKFVPQQYRSLRELVEFEMSEFGRTSLLEIELLRKDGSMVPVVGGRATLKGRLGRL